jgi:hypothetical protein
LKIHFESRFKNASFNATVYTSLDGTDCAIQEPSPFDRKWFSHKLRTAGLRYEIGLCIKTGEMVWVFGGLPCGEYPDLRLARLLFTSQLQPGEKVVADKGYRDNRYFINPLDDPDSSILQKSIMARHETINRRIKQFHVLTDTFRHDIDKHQICFYAVCNLTQLMLLNGEPLYEVAV